MLLNDVFKSDDGRKLKGEGGMGVISCQVKQHMPHVPNLAQFFHMYWSSYEFTFLAHFSICIGLHMSSHFPILYVHNLNGCRITQH